jgi:hypothetical protein
VLSAIYEQNILPCSFSGRPGLGAHHALAALNEVIVGGKIGWVLEVDLKNDLHREAERIEGIGFDQRTIRRGDLVGLGIEQIERVRLD